MEILFIIAIGFFTLLTSMVLPWINRSNINQVKIQLYFHEQKIKKLLSILEEKNISIPEQIDEQKTSPQPNPGEKTQIIHLTSLPGVSVTRAKNTEDEQIGQTTLALEKKAEPEKRNTHSFEQQFGARLPVWIGGVALALAGFFMVKYSIEAQLISPTVRVLIGLLFGVGLMKAANWIREKEGFANGTRIAQALTGAGIADLYVCLFAATNLYQIFPEFLGFIGLTAVTVIAIVCSLRHGMPIALLGLIGGFLTPAFVHSGAPPAPLLFIYLYFIVAGMVVLLRKKNWVLTALPAVLGAFLWVGYWMFGRDLTPTDSICLGLFLIAVSATVTIGTHQPHDRTDTRINNFYKTPAIINYLSLGGSILFTGLLVVQSGFGFLEWSLFGLLSLGGLTLAFFNQRLYGFVPWLCMAVNAVMLTVWNGEPVNITLLVAFFGFIYAGSGYFFQSRSERPLLWAGLFSASSLGYYLIGYYKLNAAILLYLFPMFWGVLALVFTGLGTAALSKIIKNIPDEHPKKQQLMAIYAGTSSAFLSIALMIETKAEFLTVAIAGQLLALAWINTRVDVKALRYIIGILLCVFASLLLPQIILILGVAVFTLTEVEVPFQQTIPLVEWPLFQLGLPALLFVLASVLLRKQNDGRLVPVLERVAIALTGVMGYYIVRHMFHVNENVIYIKAGFSERGVITNVIFVYGLACLWIGKKFCRDAVKFAGFVLGGIALFRIGYFDLFRYNPLFDSQNVGDFPIFNWLLVTFGLPIVWTALMSKGLTQHHKKYGYGILLLLTFAYVSFNVRQIFQGGFLSTSALTNAEIYTYSVVWLLLGIALLFAGTLKKDKMIRSTSLVIMILTVAKVFLYDAAALEGLLRVFSFLGLGLSLIALSWFYSRFVFAQANADRDK